MIASIRARLGALVAGLVLGAVLLGLAAAWLLATDAVDLDGDVRAAIVVAAATGAVLLVVGGIVQVHRVLLPLATLVRASREVTQGRHPDEAFGDAKLTGDLQVIADGMATLALRLREIDATDRRFLMSISHELRTPLTAITGHAQAIEDFADDAEMRTSSLEVIRREAVRLERLIEDIVDLARLRSNRFTTVTEGLMIDELGDHLLAIFEGAAQSNPAVRVTGTFEPVLIHSDGQRILQILRNLVGNGLRYATSHVTVTGERVAGRVRITVINDGPEIADAERDRIFEPFVGTKREGGLGLGLAIGRELAWALGGNLECCEQVGGAQFQLTLPLEPPGYGR